MRARLLPVLLAASLAFAADPPKKHVVIRVKSIEPMTAAIGQKVTVTGENLDRVNALVLGNVSPEIVEKSPTRLVFVVPRDPLEPAFSAPLFLLSPGRRVIQTSLTVIVSTGTPNLPKTAGSDFVIDEDAKVSAGKPKRYEISLLRAPAIDVTVHASGGDLEARIEPLEPPGEAITDATESGDLRWHVNTRQLAAGGRTPPKRIAITFSSDSEVSFHAKVTRFGSSAAGDLTPSK
jgi:IPT/TIG domain-containing protein